MDRQLDEALRVLGIPADSDRETLTSAYRARARATHPDVSPEPDAAEQFAAVTGAYRALSAAGDPGPRSRHASDAEPEVRPRLGQWPAASWRRPPIVAGPVMVRGAHTGRLIRGW